MARMAIGFHEQVSISLSPAFLPFPRTDEEEGQGRGGQNRQIDVLQSRRVLRVWSGRCWGGAGRGLRVGRRRGRRHRRLLQRLRVTFLFVVAWLACFSSASGSRIMVFRKK